MAATTTRPIETLPAIKIDPGAVARIAEGIDVKDRAGLVTFGDAAQRSVTEFADRILAQTRNKELGKTGDLLNDIILKVKGLDAASVEDAGFLERVFTSVKARFERFRQRFEDVASQVDAVALDLDRHKEVLKRDIALLDQLHEETASSIANLETHIAAGKQFAARFRQADLPALKASADAAGSEGPGLMAAQAYRDAEQALDRLEKRIFYLQQARQIGIQQLPQIRLVQAGDETLIENLQATARLTIPAWKQKMIVLLGLTHQKEALDMQRTVTDATNEMMRQASEMMKDQAIDIEKQAQRGIVDMETLEKTNRDLIETVTSVLQVQADGRRKRAEAEAQMERMTQDLRKALAEARSSTV